jgi:hypothetical protein
MISSLNGEVGFTDGLCIGAHAPLATISTSLVSRRKLPVPDWSQIELGVHRSDRGDFQVEASVSGEQRVEALFLSHSHPFYQPDTPEDAERRIYHDGVIATDLCGQREFSWGQVFCRFNPQIKRDWLVVVYNPFANVPLHARSVEMLLFAHESFLSDRD